MSAYNEDDMLTPDQAAVELNLATADLVYRLLRAGRIRGVKNGQRWLIPYREVELRRLRVERNRSSASHKAEEREARRAAIKERFAPLGVQSS